MDIIINSVLSAMIGFNVPYIIKFLGFLIKRWSKSNLRGEWFSYSFLTQHNHPTLVQGRIIIQRGILVLFKTLVFENGLKYKGKLYLENNHIIMIHKIKTEFRNEIAFIRVDCSRYSNQSKYCGLWLSYDSNNQICSGAILISRDELSPECAENELINVSETYNTFY